MNARFRNHLCCWFALAGLLAFSGTLRADILEQKQGPATLTVSAAKVKDSKIAIPLSGELVLTLSVEGTALQVKSGERIVTGGAWQLTTTTPGKIVALLDGKQRWEEALHLEPMLPGEHTLQLTPLEYRAGDGPWQQAPWQDYPVTVTTTITKPDKSMLHGPPPIEELPRAEPIRVGPWLLVGIALLLVLGMAVWLLKRRQKVQVAPLAPEQAALRELERLRTELPATPEESGEFHTLLANVLRVYLEARFQVPAPRQTAEEYCQKLTQSPLLADEQLTLLRDCLRRCELPKFAPLTTLPEECLQTLALARVFVEYECKRASYPNGKKAACEK